MSQKYYVDTHFASRISRLAVEPGPLRPASGAAIAGTNLRCQVWVTNRTILGGAGQGALGGPVRA